MPAGSPRLDLTPRKLPSTAVPPRPRGQRCPGDLPQPLGLRATTRYLLIAGLHLVVKAGRWQKPLQAASSPLKRPFRVRDHPGRGFEAACPQGGHNPDARPPPSQPGVVLPHSPAQPSAPALGLDTPRSPCQRGTGPVVQPPSRVVGQDGDPWGHTHGHRPRRCSGLPTHHQQERRAAPSLARASAPTGRAAGAGFGENGWETSPEPVPKADPKPAESRPFLARPTSETRAAGEASSPGAI